MDTKTGDIAKECGRERVCDELRFKNDCASMDIMMRKQINQKLSCVADGRPWPWKWTGARSNKSVWRFVDSKKFYRFTSQTKCLVIFRLDVASIRFVFRWTTTTRTQNNDTIFHSERVFGTWLWWIISLYICYFFMLRCVSLPKINDTIVCVLYC